MQDEHEKFAVSNADEHEMEPLKKSRWGVVLCNHDDHHGRFADEDAGTNRAISETLEEYCVQGGIAGRSVRMDRDYRESVQVFHLGEKGQRHGESVRSPHDRLISRPTDAAGVQETPRWFDKTISSTTQPFRDEIYRLRQRAAGRNRQCAWPLIRSRDTADFRPRVPRLWRQAIRALEGNLIGTYLQLEIQPHVSTARADLRQDPARYSRHRHQTQARSERPAWIYSSGHRASRRFG